jgi:hypothetical protein
MPADERLSFVLRQPRSVDAAVVDHLSQALRDLDARYDRAPSTSVLPAAAQHLSQVTFLREHAPGGRLQNTLRAVEADSATLMGQLVWDASGRRDHATANAYYDQAIAAAACTVDPAAQALPRLRKSFVALYGERTPPVGSP